MQAVLNHKTPKMARRCSQDVIKTPRDGLCWKLRWASAASEASGAIRMDSVSCRVKAVQKMPSGFVKVTEEKLFNTCPREASFSTRFPFFC